MEKEVSDDIDADTDEDELIKTANLSLDILSDLKGDDEDTVVSAVVKDDSLIEDESQFYSDKYQFNKSDFENSNDSSLNEEGKLSDGKIFFKIFLSVFVIAIILLIIFILI